MLRTVYKLSILYLFFCCCICCSPNLYKGVAIIDRQLEWSDFIGKVDPKSEFSAMTYYNVIYNYYNVRFQNNRVFFDFTVTPVFGQGSWVRGDSKNDYELLMHEQGHYNIAKAFARDLRKHFYNNRFSRNNYNQQIENVFSQLNIKYEALQKQYDSETNHCLNKKMQSTWEKKIKQLMADNL